MSRRDGLTTHLESGVKPVGYGGFLLGQWLVQLVENDESSEMFDVKSFFLWSFLIPVVELCSDVIYLIF